MRKNNILAALIAAVFAVSACSDRDLVSPNAAAVANATEAAMLAEASQPSVRISEVHYDNASTDQGEAIEISGLAGTDVTGWTLVLYNGANGASYTPLRTFAGTIPATCGDRGVLFQTYASNGIQNGNPDGIALVDNGGTVVEFLSYGGTMLAVGGPANGLTSTDIGRTETATTPVGHSLQRNADGTWNAAAASTFGACNDGTTNPPVAGAVARVTISPANPAIAIGATQSFVATAYDANDATVPAGLLHWETSDAAVATVTGAGVATAVAAGVVQITATSANGKTGTATLTVNPAPPPVTLPPVRFTELHYDNFGADIGEAIEIEGPAGTSLAGWQVLLYNGSTGAVYNTQALTGLIPAQCDNSSRGVVVVDYPTNGIFNTSPNGFALVDASGAVVEFLSYEGVLTATDGPAMGRASTDIGVLQNSAPLGTTLQRAVAGTWSSGADNLGGCNDRTPGVPRTSFSFSGRSPSDAPLPVGFEAQIFATARQGTASVPFVWSSDTPGIATIDADGVIHAHSAGVATFRATTTDGMSTGTYSLTMAEPVASTTAAYAGNAEFGEPSDGDASNDFIIRRPEFVSSFNTTRNTPNWVAYNLEATHLVTGADRCNCFTFDPELPQARRYTTDAFTGVGDVYNRGHLVRSADRTTGTLDNARTYYFSNIVPQAADNNQGPWAAMETYLGNLARDGSREVYILAGVAGNVGTLKNEGNVVIPASVWKVAVILPRDQGLASVTSLSSAEVLAVIMPNVNGIRNVAWENYKTSVDAVELLSGYDLLALLRDDLEIAIESNTKPPVASMNGPFNSAEGGAVALSGATSTDPDANDELTYAWQFGDGTTGTGVNVVHTYTQDGSYDVRLIATDSRGLADTVFTTSTITNVPPVIGSFSGATLLPGETYMSGGSFLDAGADGWTATVSFGDGTATLPLSLNGRQFALTHTYATAGTYAVTVRVSDDDVTTERVETVVVLTPVAALERASLLLQELGAAGKLGKNDEKQLLGKIEVLAGQIEKGNVTAALAQLDHLLVSLDEVVASGRASPADVAALRSLLTRTIDALSGEHRGGR